jgi:mannose-1-phosphate guanylyltransferase
MDWAVIIAGGSGTRFWPLSTPARPKQLLPLAGPGSTAEATLARLDGMIDPERILLVTGPRLAGPLAERLRLPAGNILIEPVAKSTGPALLWATLEAARRDPRAVVLAQHADWHVPDSAAFQRVARRALSAAGSEPLLITVGIVPTRPDTGYGYIVPDRTNETEPRRVARFVEKPSESLAKSLIADGALWNSGLFCWSAATLRSEVERVTPELAAAIPALDRDDVAGFFGACAEISIDVGVLERSRSVAVVRGDFSWDDIGTWDALARVRAAAADGNVLVGQATAVGASGCVVWSEKTPIVVAGVTDLVVVEANDRILVIPRSEAARLKQILEALPPAVREV